MMVRCGPAKWAFLFAMAFTFTVYSSNRFSLIPKDILVLLYFFLKAHTLNLIKLSSYLFFLVLLWNNCSYWSDLRDKVVGFDTV